MFLTSSVFFVSEPLPQRLFDAPMKMRGRMKAVCCAPLSVPETSEEWSYDFHLYLHVHYGTLWACRQLSDHLKPLLVLSHILNSSLLPFSSPFAMASDKWIEDLKTDIRRRRLEALKKSTFIIPEMKCQTAPWRAPSYYRWMESWSEKAEGQITSAILKGACSTHYECQS